MLKTDIIILAKLCVLSYLTREELHNCYNYQRPYNKESYKNVLYSISEEPMFIHCIDTDCQLLMVKFKEFIIVVFRGTESKKDIITDLEIFQKSFLLKNTSVIPKAHEGFLKQFLSVKKCLINTIGHSRCKKVIFCGHSMGGAIATIASLYFSFYFRERSINCVSFGSPRVGNSLFVNLFNKTVNESIRYVNDNDPVPCFPTKWRYRHVKGLRWIHNDVIKNEIIVWRFYRFVKNMFLNSFGYGYNALKDHNCIHYLEDI